MDGDDEPVHLPSLLKCLLECSETGSSIAKVFRLDSDLYRLMIQEKKGAEKNLRFVHDVKTFADVLVQEAVKWNIRRKFSHLYKNVFGEETNQFTDTRGKTVKIQISGDVQETTKSMCELLDGDKDAANLLAVCIHMSQEVEFDTPLMNEDITLPSNRIGIWIDPIDATNEYVYGAEDRTPGSDFSARRGLKCVTVLIGAFDILTGIPIIGIINQPFYRWDLLEEQFKSAYFWGFHHDGHSGTSVISIPLHLTMKEKQIFISSSEDEKLLDIIRKEYGVREMAGAGYKLLGVARGHADLYVVSQSFTYQWDTCAAHAVLLSLGGGIISFSDAINSESLSSEDISNLQLKYKVREEDPSSNNHSHCNVGGLIAYRSQETLLEFVNHVKSLW